MSIDKLAAVLRYKNLRKESFNDEQLDFLYKAVDTWKEIEFLQFLVNPNFSVSVMEEIHNSMLDDLTTTTIPKDITVKYYSTEIVKKFLLEIEYYLVFWCSYKIVRVTHDKLFFVNNDRPKFAKLEYPVIIVHYVNDSRNILEDKMEVFANDKTVNRYITDNKISPNGLTKISHLLVVNSDYLNEKNKPHNVMYNYLNNVYHDNLSYDHNLFYITNITDTGNHLPLGLRITNKIFKQDYEKFHSEVRKLRPLMTRRPNNIFKITNRD